MNSGSPSVHVVEVTEETKVGEIQDLLGLEALGDDYMYLDLSFFNQCSEVDNKSLVVDWFEPEDVVKVWIGVPSTPDREKRAGGEKNIRNLSGDEIILVAQTRERKLPVFLKEYEIWALQFNSWAWTNKIEIWR